MCSWNFHTHGLHTDATRSDFPEHVCQANNYALKKQAEQLSKFAAAQLDKDTNAAATTDEEKSKGDGEDKNKEKSKKEQDEEPQTESVKTNDDSLNQSIADLEERLKQTQQKLRSVQTELGDKAKLIEKKNERIVSLQKENNLLIKEKRQMQDGSGKKQK